MNRKRIHRKLKLKISIVLILCLTQLCVPVFADTYELDIYYEIGSGNITYSYDDLLSFYRANSITYKRNMLEYQIQALNGTLAEENHSNINAQHVDILNRLEELEQTKQALIEYKNALLSHEA